MANHKLRETFDVILGGERTTESTPPGPATTKTSPGGTRSSVPGTPSTISSATSSAIPSAEVERFVALAEGGFFFPNFISDYVLRDLSLGEQSVLNRLLRLTQGINVPSGKLRIKDVAEACGISPEFAIRTVESLEEKGLLRILRHNPFTRTVRYRLDVLKQWQGKLVLCAVCHGPIRPQDEMTLVPVARSLRGIQEVPVHNACLEGDPS